MGRSLVFLIDVEPDARAENADVPWNATAAALACLADMRERWQQATGAPVHFNWFLRFDPQIEHSYGRTGWVDRCPGLIEEIQKLGDLAGTHIHFWRWHEARRLWYNDFSDPRWLRQSIAQSVEGFREVFGYAPAAARFGDRWVSDAALELLCEYGFAYDLSVEPGVPERWCGGDPLGTAPLPDSRGAPRQPHRFVSPGGSLWMVPLTVTRRDYWLPYHRFPFVQWGAQPFNLVVRPEIVWRDFARELERETAEPLVFVARTGDFNRPKCRASFDAIAQRMLHHPGIAGCRFLRVEAAVERFAAAQAVTV